MKDDTSQKKSKKKDEQDKEYDEDASLDEQELQKLSFERALVKLESNVRTLEKGELTLEESLTLFEEGMKLARFCSRKLDEAEKKIEILIEKDGEFARKKFEIPAE